MRGHTFRKKIVIATPGFVDVISRERFELICKCLHFIDNENLPTYQGPPKFFEIYPVMSFEQKISNPISTKPKHYN